MTSAPGANSGPRTRPQEARMAVDVDVLRGLLEQATPGPWVAALEVRGADSQIVGAGGLIAEVYRKKSDAALIAAMHAAFPVLLDELVALRKELAATSREADRLRHGEAIEGDFVCPNDLTVTALADYARRLREASAQYRAGCADHVGCYETVSFGGSGVPLDERCPDCIHIDAILAEPMPGATEPSR